MELITLVAFALALNMDALGTGVAYGIRNIRIPFTSLLIISGMSVVTILVSMLAGRMVSQLISATFAHRLGGIILLLVGIWILIQSLRENRKENQEEGPEEIQTVMELRIRFLGVVIQVLREPSRADLDSSGVISAREAVLLGAALAMDAFGAGFAVSMMGFNPFLTAAVVGIGHIILTYAGLLAGKTFACSCFGRQLAMLPGCILIAMGILKIR
ncbi:sporulation protein YtaF [Desulfotomaculum nigrificans CO-1-SRB]|uniref:Sporulation protein YtaF n=1 Tax=Desulfotomaculum nigrificans (strain DSM 14880 / VKM B-2319 / CO-1-SRB) TaxID=868595 RepID=F6B2R6_DESCC|nr:sporulation membrane protein YtaF [Desulfotomaculum nigrificans]AEF93895.1 sporulation protein YtaF [Desulfotomaculum nigrificans CO-1-SRB]